MLSQVCSELLLTVILWVPSIFVIPRTPRSPSPPIADHVINRVQNALIHHSNLPFQVKLLPDKGS